MSVKGVEGVVGWLWSCDDNDDDDGGGGVWNGGRVKGRKEATGRGRTHAETMTSPC